MSLLLSPLASANPVLGDGGVMSSAMDKAMMAMSLEEEDVPLDMPFLPEYSSCERNFLSLVGRTLNPACQPMDHLIRTMPRKWQKIGRCRGVALSKERFQFFFNSEHDLVEIGQVKEVAFDVTKPQLQEFVRVKVIFDVSRPLRRSKLVNLPNGGGTATAADARRAGIPVTRPKPPPYLRVSSDEERLLRIDKVKISVGEVEKDLFSSKSVLRLEPLPVFHDDLSKEKGVVYNFEKSSSPVSLPREAPISHSLVEASIKSGADRLWLMDEDSSCSVGGSGSFLALSQPYQNISTVSGPCSFAAGSSGNVLAKTKSKSRKRPSKYIRKEKPLLQSPQLNLVEVGGGALKGFKEKRKAEVVGSSTVKLSKLNPQE
ncbi:unnamed protein product, partial [Arabidopsis halleri]